MGEAAPGEGQAALAQVMASSYCHWSSYRNVILMQGGLPELERRGGCRGREGAFRRGEWRKYNVLFTIGMMTHGKYLATLSQASIIILSVLDVH